tara:strand:- start:681 stop:962 length:282 start_codon:yes stop_codon:yes gene_type:complete
MIIEKPTAKNNNLKFEYYSESSQDYIDFDDMDGEYMKNVVRKVIRENLRLPVRITEYDINNSPVDGRFACLTTEPHGITLMKELESKKRIQEA